MNSLKNLFLPLLILVAISTNCFSQNETEPNGNFNNANPFVAPVTISAGITTNSPDDRDFFKIVLPSCQTWAFRVDTSNTVSFKLLGHDKVWDPNRDNIKTIILMCEVLSFIVSGIEVGNQQT
jgi:hypothetical protein